MTKRRVAVYRGDMPQLAAELVTRLSAAGIAVSVDREHGGEDLVVGLFASSSSARIRYHEGVAAGVRDVARALGEGSGWRTLPMYVPALRGRRNETGAADGPAVRIEVPRHLPLAYAVASVEAGLRRLWGDSGEPAMAGASPRSAAGHPSIGAWARARMEAERLRAHTAANGVVAPDMEAPAEAAAPHPLEGPPAAAGMWADGEDLGPAAGALVPADGDREPRGRWPESGAEDPPGEQAEGLAREAGIEPPTDPADRRQPAVDRVVVEEPAAEVEVAGRPAHGGDGGLDAALPQATVADADDAALDGGAEPEPAPVEPTGWGPGLGEEADGPPDGPGAVDVEPPPQAEDACWPEPADAGEAYGREQDADLTEGEVEPSPDADAPPAGGVSPDGAVDQRPRAAAGDADAAARLAESPLSLALAIVECLQRAAAARQYATSLRATEEEADAPATDTARRDEPEQWEGAPDAEGLAPQWDGEVESDEAWSGDSAWDPDGADAGAAGGGDADQDVDGAADAEGEAPAADVPAAECEGYEEGLPWDSGEVGQEPDLTAAGELYPMQVASLDDSLPPAAESPLDEGPGASADPDDYATPPEPLTEPSLPAAGAAPSRLARMERLAMPSSASSLPPGFGPFGIGRRGPKDGAGAQPGPEGRPPDGGGAGGARPGGGGNGLAPASVNDGLASAPSGGPAASASALAPADAPEEAAGRTVERAGSPPATAKAVSAAPVPDPGSRVDGGADADRDGPTVAGALAAVRPAVPAQTEAVTGGDPVAVRADGPTVSRDPPAVRAGAPTVSADPPAVDGAPSAVGADPVAVGEDPPAEAEAVAGGHPAAVTADPTAVGADAPAVRRDLQAVGGEQAAVRADPPAVGWDPPADGEAAAGGDATAVRADPTAVRADAATVRRDLQAVGGEQVAVRADPPAVGWDPPGDGEAAAGGDPPAVGADRTAVRADAPTVRHDPPAVDGDQAVVRADAVSLGGDAPCDGEAVASGVPAAARAHTPSVSGDPPAEAVAVAGGDPAAARADPADVGVNPPADADAVPGGDPSTESAYPSAVGADTLRVGSEASAVSADPDMPSPPAGDHGAPSEGAERPDARMVGRPTPQPQVRVVLTRPTVTPMHPPVPPGASPDAAHPFRAAVAPPAGAVPFRPAKVYPPAAPALPPMPAAARAGASWLAAAAPQARNAATASPAPVAAGPDTPRYAGSPAPTPFRAVPPPAGVSAPAAGWPPARVRPGRAPQTSAPRPSGDSAFVPRPGGGWLPAVAPMVGPPGPNARRLAEAHVLVPFR